MTTIRSNDAAANSMSWVIATTDRPAARIEAMTPPTPEIAALVAASLAAVGLSDERATNPYDLDLSRRKLVALAGVLA